MSNDDIPYPKIDLDRVSNPIPAILSTSEFKAGCRYFEDRLGRGLSLVSDIGRALLYTLIRNQRPSNVVEIGTYRGGTTEIMARAVAANRTGTIHTVSPFDADEFLPIYKGWPQELQDAVRFHPVNSMSFFDDIRRQGIQPEMVFVDGNHEYEFALFDILCAARSLTPNGFIIVDDAGLAGPYFAARDFLANHPDWRECPADQHGEWDRTRAYDRSRSHIRDSQFLVLRAPPAPRLSDGRPLTIGEMPWPKVEANGVALSLDGQQDGGTLHVQCILRGYGGGLPSEIVMNVAKEIPRNAQNAEVTFPKAPDMPSRDRHTLELLLIWTDQKPLVLTGMPVPF